jgi:hypothetical protein
MSRFLSWSVVTAVVVAAPVFAEQKTLTIDSEPAGAEVEIAGKFVGLTPITLEYPASHFREPATVWGNYLGEPLKVTLRKDGYKTKVIELGDGPHAWASLDGSNRFEYYLLDSGYTIELEESDAASGTNALAAAEAIRALADLRDDGLISDSEFEEKKTELLASISSGPTRDTHYKLAQDSDPERLCPRLLASDLPTLKAGRRSYHKLLTADAETLHSEAIGPVLECVWVTPFEDVSSLRLAAQCGIGSVASACSSTVLNQRKQLGTPDDVLACFRREESTAGVAISNDLLH